MLLPDWLFREDLFPQGRALYLYFLSIDRGLARLAGDAIATLR
jgi:hypothetical protein